MSPILACREESAKRRHLNPNYADRICHQLGSALVKARTEAMGRWLIEVREKLMHEHPFVPFAEKLIKEVTWTVHRLRLAGAQAINAGRHFDEPALRTILYSAWKVRLTSALLHSRAEFLATNLLTVLMHPSVLIGPSDSISTQRPAESSLSLYAVTILRCRDRWYADAKRFQGISSDLRDDYFELLTLVWHVADAALASLDADGRPWTEIVLNGSETENDNFAHTATFKTCELLSCSKVVGADNMPTIAASYGEIRTDGIDPAYLTKLEDSVSSPSKRG